MIYLFIYAFFLARNYVTYEMRFIGKPSLHGALPRKTDFELSNSTQTCEFVLTTGRERAAAVTAVIETVWTIYNGLVHLINSIPHKTILNYIKENKGKLGRFTDGLTIRRGPIFLLISEKV